MAMVPTGGIKDRNINKSARIRTSKLADGGDSFGNPTNLVPQGVRSIGALGAASFRPGTKALAVLRVSANIVEAETVTIGPITINGVAITDVFEFDVVNTDTTVNTASGQWNNTNDPISATVTAHGLVAGDLLRVENEIVKILRVVDANTVVVARGRAGTTTAAHADGVDIFKSATPPAANIPVGVVTTLTPAVAIPALVDEIINAVCTNGERCASKASRIYQRLTAATFTNEMLLSAINPGVLTTAVAEAMAGANNAWDTAAMRGGAEPGQKRSAIVKRTPNATEVALGTMRIPLDFTPTSVFVAVITTADGLAKAWVGARLITTNLVTLDNTGATDWAATDDVYVIAHE